MSNLLAQAVIELACHCDGAYTEDGIGFNKIDSFFGRSLAARPFDTWTPKQKRASWRMLLKYKGQLLNYGINYDDIPEPPLQEEKQPLRRMSRDGEQIVVEFDYDPELVDGIKQLPARFRKYNRRGKLWAVTPAVVILDDLVGYAINFNFDVEQEVYDLLSELIENQKQLLEKSRAAESDFTVKGLGGKMYPFQKAGVEYAVKSQRCFIADEMGLGKTITSLGSIYYLNAFPAIVVCPATVKYNWALETLKWLPGKKVGMVKSKDFYRAQIGNSGRLYLEKDSHNLPGAYDLIIINYDLLRPRPKIWRCIESFTNPNGHTFNIGDTIPEPLSGFKPHTKELVKAHFKRDGFGKSKNGLIEKFLNIELKAIIIDESFYCKSHRAQRTMAVTQLSHNIPIRLALTGTPVLNRPSELISQLTILDRLNDLGGFWHFAEYYCQGHRGRWGLEMSGAMHLDELNEKMRGLLYIRRTKSQVLTELPDKQQSDIILDLDNRKEYDEAQKDLIAWLKENARVEEEFLESVADLSEEERTQAISDYRMTSAARAARALQLTRIEHLKQLAARGKLSMAKEWITDFLETGEKLVVFAHHIEIQKELIKEFKGTARLLGEDNADTRQANIDRFQNEDDCQIMVCSLKAGGMGITLTAASNVVFLELGWTPADHLQAEDRLHRIGQKNNVMAWYLLAADSIDIEIQELIKEKRAVVDATTEGNLGDVSQTSILNDLIERLIK